MEYLRLYRDFYHILTSPNFSGDSYTLINPVNISLVTKVRGTNQIIEYPTANMESTGIYYTDLTKTFQVNFLYALAVAGQELVFSFS